MYTGFDKIRILEQNSNEYEQFNYARYEYWTGEDQRVFKTISAYF